MKKLLCALFFSLTLVTGLFAEGGLGGFIENNKCERPIRLEADAGLTYGGASFEVKGAYMFRITDNLRWDLGLGVSYNTYAYSDSVPFGSNLNENQFYGGDSFNTILFGSFWFGDWYTNYGLGVGVSKAGGAAFIPFDWRIGWQPGSRENNRVAFKLEFALMGSSVACYETSGVDNISRYKKTVFCIAPRLNLGIAVRL